MELKEFLYVRGLTADAFCKIADLHPTQVSRILKKTTGLSLETAAKIELATEGKVSCMDLYYDLVAQSNQYDSNKRRKVK